MKTWQKKWKNELSKKFGFRNLYKAVSYVNGKEETIVSSNDLPKVYSIENMSDLYTLIF